MIKSDSVSVRGSQRTVLLAVFILFAFTIYVKSQSELIPKKYLEVVPGVSTRSDVEKIYSKRDTNRTFVEYDTPHFSIGIQYSLGPCELGLGVWGMPKWTVEEVFFNWAKGKKTPLRSIILEPKRFDKRQLGHVAEHDYYVNDEFGIMVVYDNELKTVSSLSLELSTKLKEKYACRKKLTTGGVRPEK
jgi:hypothetical protein